MPFFQEMERCIEILILEEIKHRCVGRSGAGETCLVGDAPRLARQRSFGTETSCYNFMRTDLRIAR